MGRRYGIESCLLQYSQAQEDYAAAKAELDQIEQAQALAQAARPAHQAPPYRPA